MLIYSFILLLFQAAGPANQTLRPQPEKACDKFGQTKQKFELTTDVIKRN